MCLVGVEGDVEVEASADVCVGVASLRISSGILGHMSSSQRKPLHCALAVKLLWRH